MKKKKRTVLFALIACVLLIFPFILSAQERPEFTRKPISYSPEWGSETLSYTHTPKLIEYYRTYSPHGLTFQSAWIVANVMDENGQKYNLLRKYETASTAMTLASIEVPGLKSRAKPIFKPGDMFLGRTFHEMDDKKGSILVKPFSPGRAAFTITINPQRVVWKDANGRIDLTFNALGPALEYYAPGRLEDAMYRSEPHWVEGTVNGKPVSGFGVFDFSWGPVGVGFVQGKIYKLLEECWIVWLNLFADGSKECGIFVDGVDQFEAFYYNKDGKARVTRNNKLEMTYTADGFIKGATITMDDLKFKYTTESRVMQVPTTLVAWASGRMINVNDPRKPVKSFAWLEFFPKGKR